MALKLDNISDPAKDLIDWWLPELSKVVRYRPTRANLPKLTVRSNGLSLVRLDGRVVSCKAIDEVIPQIDARSCDVILGADRFLVRKISNRRVPHKRILEIAKADLLSTPFKSQDVRLFPVVSPSEVSASYGIVRKTTVDPIFNSLSSAGIQVGQITLATEKIQIPLPVRSRQLILGNGGAGRFGRNTFSAALTALILVAILTYGHLYYRYSLAEDSLASELSEKQAAAVAVRKGIESRAKQLAALDAARRGKGDAIPVVKIWEELTRVLPDTTWINTLSVDGNQLTFAGFSQSAASLIEPLEQSPIFNNPSFTSPVVKIPGENGERFEIRLGLRSP